MKYSVRAPSTESEVGARPCVWNARLSIWMGLVSQLHHRQILRQLCKRVNCISMPSIFATVDQGNGFKNRKIPIDSDGQQRTHVVVRYKTSAKRSKLQPTYPTGRIYCVYIQWTPPMQSCIGREKTPDVQHQSRFSFLPNTSRRRNVSTDWCVEHSFELCDAYMEWYCFMLWIDVLESMGWAGVNNRLIWIYNIESRHYTAQLATLRWRLSGSLLTGGQ